MSSSSEILLVDDHIGDISWLVDFLEAHGYVVDQVTNEEAEADFWFFYLKVFNGYCSCG